MKKSALKRFFSTSKAKKSKAPALVQEERPPVDNTSKEERDERDERDEIEEFMQTFVYPVAEARRQGDLLTKRADETNTAIETKPPSKLPTDQTPNVIKEIPLPKDLWNRHILSRVPEESLRLFAEAYQSSPNIFNDFYNDSFNFKQFNPLPLFMQAKKDGVNINVPLLHQLCSKPKAYLTMQALHFETNASWVIAALCGDIKWLLDKFGENFISQSTQYKEYQRNILFFLTFSGHLDLIKKYFPKALARQRNSKANHELNHLAASSGFFDICDYFETEYNESPFSPFGILNETTVHYFAFYGDLIRLKEAIVRKPDLLIQFPHGKDLLCSAVKGGDVDAVRFLVNGNTAAITQPQKFTGETCFHLAAKNGHAKLLQLFVNEFKCPPPQELSITQDILLSQCGISGSWDCFWLLYPYFASHPMLSQTLALIPMYAIARNHVDFFDQFIQKFGETFAGKENHRGDKISHYTLFSANFKTIRKMLNEHNMNLTEKNNKGEIAILELAKEAADQNSDLSWFVISSILSEFNAQYDSSLHLIPDNTGITLEKLILQQGKQDLFPDIQFETSACPKLN